MVRVEPVKFGERCKMPIPSQALQKCIEGVETRRQGPNAKAMVKV